MARADLGLGPTRQAGAPEGLDLDFAGRRFWRGGRRLPTPENAPEWAFVREGAAFGEGRAHPLEERAADAPRLTRGGLLLEGAATNLLSRSVEFETGAWTRTAAGTGTAPVVVGTSPDPAGGMTARRMVFDRGGGEGSGDISLMYHADFASTVGATYVGSLWARADVPTTLLMRHVGADAYLTMEIDGTWRRFHLASTAAAASSVLQIALRGGYGVPQTATVDLWNVQCEADHATSDVVSGAEPRSRAAEELGFVQPETAAGAIMTEWTPTAVTGTRILIEGGGLRLALVEGAVSATAGATTLSAGGTIATGQPLQVALCWEPGRIAMAVNGDVSAGAADLALGGVSAGWGTGGSFVGRLRRWRRLNRALGNAALAAVTS